MQRNVSGSAGGGGRIKREPLSGKAGVYEDPTVLDDDENLVKAVKKMNGYAKTKITFTVGDSKEVLDASVFGDWFRLNKS